MSTPVRSSGAGRSQEVVQKFVDLALREVWDAVQAKYFKTPESLGPLANAVLKEITQTATRLGQEGATKPGKGGVLQAAARLAAAILLDTKGQGEIREGFKGLVRAVAGDPPQVDDEKNAKLGKHNNTSAAGVPTLPKSHILWVLLDRLGLSNPKFGPNAREALKRDARLDDKSAWHSLAIDLADAVLKDGAELAKSLVQKLVGADVTATAAATKTNGQNGQTVVPDSGAIPKETIGEADTSNTARRASADSSPMLTLVKNLAASTAATRAKRDKRDLAEIKGELAAPEVIARHVADALGVQGDHPGLAIAAKILEKTFAPYQEYQNPTKFDALEALLKTLIKASADKLGSAEDKVKRAERAHRQAVSGAQQETIDKAKDALDRAVLERDRLKNEHAALSSQLEHAQAIRYETSRVGASESMDKAFGYLIGQALGKLVGDALQLPPSQRQGLDRLDTLDKIYNGLFHQRDRADRTGIERLEDRVNARATGETTSPPPTLPQALHPLIDASKPAETAEGIAKQFQVLGQPEYAELRSKFVGALEALLRKHQPKTDLDFVTRVSQALVDNGVSNEAASIVTLWTTAIHAKYESALRDGQIALDRGRKKIEDERQRVATAETELESKRSALEELKENIPSDGPRKAEAERAIADLEKTIADYESKLASLKKDLESARKELPKLLNAVKGLREQYTAEMHGMSEMGLEQLLRALLDPKATEQFLMEKLKPMLQQEGILPKDDKKADGGNRPPPNDPPRDPPPPGGGDDDFGGRTPGSSNLPHRGEPTPAQMRALECAAVLADPCLSIQDKVFYFMMIFAKWSDKEREDKLRELTKQEEEAARWDAQRQDISKSQDARLEERRNVNKELDKAEKHLEKLKQRVEAGEIPPDSEEYKKAQERVANLNERSQDLTRGIEKLGDELREAANKADKAPRARELIFSEIDKITKFRDQMINMARSMIDDANRLIERIFR